MKLVKKFRKVNWKRFILFAFVPLLLATTITPALAQTDTLEVKPVKVDTAYGEYLKGDDGLYCDDTTCEDIVNDGAVAGTADALLTGLIGGDLDGVPLYSKETGDEVTIDGVPIRYRKSGALASTLNVTDQFRRNPPASGIVYAQQELEKIKGEHKAYAAAEDTWVYYPGLGFNVLNPIQKYWNVSRNIAYITMIFIMVIVAFLVAFRSNFGGQTQVSIANSIPNIILALVMITISFPLSGFAIDLITIGSNLMQQILVQNTFSPGYEAVWEPDEIDQVIITGTSVTLAPQLENPKTHLQPDDRNISVWQIFSTGNINLTGQDTFINGKTFIGQGYEGSGDAVVSIIPGDSMIGSVLENILYNLAEAGIAQLFLQLVFSIAAFMASLKLFFKLLTKYLILVLYPAVSPFLMLTIAIPGQGSKTIMNYFKTLISAALAFIAVYAVFLFIIVIGHDSEFQFNMKYTPPLLGYEAEPDNIGFYVRMLIGFGLFLATPSIPDMIDATVGTFDLNQDQAISLGTNQVDTEFRGGLKRGIRYSGGLWRNTVGRVTGSNPPQQGTP